MIYENENMKYKYIETENFGVEGYYVDTVGKILKQ